MNRDRFTVEHFDAVEDDTPFCVVDHLQVGADGERFIIGRYATPELANEIQAALERARIYEWELVN